MKPFSAMEIDGSELEVINIDDDSDKETADVPLDDHSSGN